MDDQYIIFHQNEISGAYVKQALSVDAFKATD